MLYDKCYHYVLLYALLKELFKTKERKSGNTDLFTYNWVLHGDTVRDDIMGVLAFAIETAIHWNL